MRIAPASHIGLYSKSLNIKRKMAHPTPQFRSGLFLCLMDEDGHQFWQRILKTIDELQDKEPPEGAALDGNLRLIYP